MATLLALGTAVPIVLGVSRHEPLLGVLGSVGALYTGLASFGNVHRVRLGRMALTSVAVAALAVLGATAHASDAASIVLVALVGFLFSMFGATSAVNSLVGILGTAIFIVLAGLPSRGQSPWTEGLAILLGGMLQTAFVAVVGPLFPRTAERVAVAETYASLARYLRTVARTSEVDVPEALPFREAHARLNEGLTHDASDEHGRLRHALRIAETLRAAIPGFARAYLNAGEAHAEAANGALNALESDLRDLEEAIDGGRYNVLASIAAHPVVTGDAELDRWVRLFASSFEEAARPPLPIPPGDRPSRTGWGVAFQNLWNSPTLRRLSLAHAIRFGLALALGTAIYRTAHLPLGYWIPLTTTFLLRPDYATTVVKGFGRFVGTFLGVVLASLCVAYGPADPWYFAGLAIAGGWFMFALFEMSFALYIVALTFYVIVGLAALGRSELSVGIERTYTTAIGAILAVGTTFVWPVWESRRVRGVFREAFQSQLAFGDGLIRLPHGGSTVEELEDLRHQARQLRVEAERLVEASQLEPRWSRDRDADDALEWIERLDANAATLLSLHAQALEQRAGRIPEEPEGRASLQRAISEARLMGAKLG